MPLVFEGRSVSALCEQLKDPEQNGHHTSGELLAHVEHDPLVLWGWRPGGQAANARFHRCPFQRLLDEVRHDSARRLLVETDLDVGGAVSRHGPAKFLSRPSSAV